MQQTWDTTEGPAFTDALFGAFETPRDVVEFLTDEHREVEDLFDRIEGTTARAYQTRAKLIATLCEKLTMHTMLEEKYFYPVVKNVDSQSYFEAQEEHQAVKNLIRRLKKVRGHEDDLEAKVKFLKELVHHHFQEEEAQIFPEVKRQIEQSKLVQIADKMAAELNRKRPAANKVKAKKMRRHATAM